MQGKVFFCGHEMGDGGKKKSGKKKENFKRNEKGALNV